VVLYHLLVDIADCGTVFHSVIRAEEAPTELRLMFFRRPHVATNRLVMMTCQGRNRV
jgi:hypothetical protein